MLGSGTSRSNTPIQNTKAEKKNKSERNNNKRKLEKRLRKNFSIGIDFSFSLKGFSGEEFYLIAYLYVSPNFRTHFGCDILPIIKYFY